MPFKRNTFGASLGAPILKDKVFLFGDYQGVRENTPLNPQVLTVPTALMRTGNFTQLLGQSTTNLPAFCTPRTVVNGAIYDPTTCAQFVSNGVANVIPTSRLNPAAVNYLNAYPLPNVPGTNNGTLNNYRTIRNDVRHFNTFDARADYNAGARDHAFARFTYDNSAFTRTSEFANLPAGFASGSNNVHGRGYASARPTSSPRTSSTSYAQGTTATPSRTPPSSRNVPISANLGIVNANRTSNLGGGALIGGNANHLEYTGDYGLYAVPENTYEINDAVTYTRGHHSIKLGASGIRRDVAFFRPISGKGYFNIGGGDFTGYEPAELLAGFIDNYSIGSQSGFFGTRNFEYGGFAQDDWKVSNHLTLNLGSATRSSPTPPRSTTARPPSTQPPATSTSPTRTASPAPSSTTTSATSPRASALPLTPTAPARRSSAAATASSTSRIAAASTTSLASRFPTAAPSATPPPPGTASPSPARRP